MWFYCEHCRLGMIVKLTDSATVKLQLRHVCGYVMRMVGSAAVKVAA